MSKKKHKPSKAHAQTFPIAVPPNAPKPVRDIMLKLMTELITFRSLDDSEEAAAQLHGYKALALITVAAFHISHMPDDAERQSLLEKTLPLMNALVRDNEKARRGLGTPASMPPGSITH